MAKRISYTDSLRQGADKINNYLENNETIANEAKNTSQQANSTSNKANQTAEEAKSTANEAKSESSAALQYNVGKWLEPVATYADIPTTYTSPEDNDRVWVRDTGKAYVYRNSAWEEFMEVNETQVNEVDNRLSSQLATNEKDIDGRGINAMYPPVPLVGAKGDGVADDYNALQNLHDFCYDNNIKTLFIPEPSDFYNISKPLLVKTKRESTSVKWWDGKAVRLIGAHKASTKIIKTTSDTLSGVNAEVDGVDSTIILYAGEKPDGSSGGTGTGIDIENLYIVNESANDGSMAITGEACQRMHISELNIEAYSGIVLPGAFSTTIREVVAYCTENAYVLTGVCTSNRLEKTYAPNCKNPYVINSTYSSLDTMYADGATGTVFDVSGRGTTMKNCGTESPHAQYIVKSDHEITIDALSIHRQTGSDTLAIENCAVFYGGGKIKCGTLSMLENAELTGNSYLFSSDSINSNSSLEIGRIEYLKNYSGTENPKLLYSDQNSSSISKGKLSVNGSNLNIRRNKKMPYVGSWRSSDSLQTEFVDKAIYLDNETKTTDSAGNDNGYEQKYNKGDVLLINDPKLKNVLGYVVLDGGATYVRDGTFAEIPIVMSGTTAERPTQNLYIGLEYKDTDLKKTVTWYGSDWYDESGAVV